MPSAAKLHWAHDRWLQVVRCFGCRHSRVRGGDIPAAAQVNTSLKLAGTLLWQNAYFGEGGAIVTYSETNLTIGTTRVLGESQIGNSQIYPSIARNANGDTAKLENDGTIVMTGPKGENPSRIPPTRLKDSRGKVEAVSRSGMAISPDASKVAFVAANYDGFWIVVRGRNGESITAFYPPNFQTIGPASGVPWCEYAAPTWTPDGRLIVIALEGAKLGNPAPNVEKCGPTTLISDRKLEQLSPIWQNLKGVNSPTISPNGQQVSFIGDDKSLWVARFDGGGRQRVIKPDPNLDPLVVFSSLVWSPDGRVFAATANNVLVAVPLETGRIQVLRGRDSKLLAASGDGAGENRVLAWSR